MNRIVSSITSFIVFLSVGCGDSGGSKVIDGSTQLRDLTQSQAQPICESLASSFQSVFSAEQVARVSCFITGVVLAEETEVNCLEFANECMENVPDVSELLPEIDFGCDSISQDLVNCTATLDELEACFDTVLDPEPNFFENISCDSSVEEIASFEDFEPFTSDICLQFQEKCPDLEF